MGALAEIVLPIFALVALGYAAGTTRRMSDSDLRALNDFVFWIATPALLFGAVTAAQPQDAGRLAVAYFGAALALFAASVLLAQRALRADLAQAGVFALSCIFGNTVMLGIPIIAAAYGPQGLATLMALVALHAAVLLPVATAVVEIGQQRGVRLGRLLRATLVALARNPIIVAMLLALAWRATGLAVPGALRRLLDLLGSGAPALALFCLGGSLAGFRLAGEVPQAALAGAIKLLAMPAMVAASCWLLGIGGLAFAVAVTTAALPTGANAFMLARRYGTLTGRSASTVVLTTAAGVVTLSALLAILR